MSINKVMITGNLTRDGELRQTPNGTAILNLGVAVNDRRRNQQTGDWDEYANFVDCTMFGKRAEGLAPYLKKGTKVAIEGRLHYSQWQDRSTGQNRSKLDVTVDEIEFMSSRSSGGNYGDGGYQNNGGYQGGYQDNGGYQNGGAYQSNGGYQNNGGYQDNGGYQNNGGYSQGYNNAQQQQPRSTDIPEPPAPAAYNDEDIPF